jgi:hypothetical protein
MTVQFQKKDLKQKGFSFSTRAAEHRVFLFQIEPDTEAKRDPA